MTYKGRNGDLAMSHTSSKKMGTKLQLNRGMNTCPRGCKALEQTPFRGAARERKKDISFIANGRRQGGKYCQRTLYGCHIKTQRSWSEKEG